MSRTGRWRYLLRPLFRLPAQRFARLIARFEARVPAEGLPGGARQLLSDLAVSVTTRGTEYIPHTGPLLVVSNHPGAYDSVALTAHIPRPDLHVVVSDIPFLRVLPETGSRFIFVPSQSDGRTAALRSSIQHLQQGGAVLIFAHGDVEPDPAFMPGAREALNDWSRSIEIMLRKVPHTWLQIAIASDVLIPRFVYSPITHLRQKLSQRQKLGEVMQIIQQLLLPNSVQACAHLSFDRPVAPPTCPPRRSCPPSSSAPGFYWMNTWLRFIPPSQSSHPKSLNPSTPTRLLPPVQTGSAPACSAPGAGRSIPGPPPPGSPRLPARPGWGSGYP